VPGASECLFASRGISALLLNQWNLLVSGALQKAFEQLKAKLLAEGLFDDAIKKAFPFCLKNRP